MRARIVAAVFFLAPSAWAYRPFDGTDADVADPGRFELEIGPVYTRAREKRLALPQTVLNLGVIPRVELVVDFTALAEPWPRLDGNDVLVKTVLRKGSLQEESGPSVALETGPLLPTFDSRSFGASANLIVSQRWDALTLHFDEELEYTRTGEPAFFSGIIVEGPGALTLRPVAEVFVSQEWKGDFTVSALAGMILRVSDELTFDAAGRAAWVDGEPLSEVRVGLTLAFPVWKPRAAPSED
jgi:hypothetical protein